MTDVFDLEIRYAPQLEVAKKHLSSTAKNAGRSQLGPEKIQHLYDSKADCPICGIVFEGGNHNTEHIFPIALGGKNTMDNKIQLCVLCNNSRNQVMQAIIGNSPRSRYPDNWIPIKKTLLWHLITIDDGISAGEAISTPHEKFMQYRTGGNPFPNQPNRAYGRFSTWKIGDKPNYPHNHSSNNQNSRQKTSTPSLTLSVFDWIFGYKSRDLTKPKKVKTSTIDEGTEGQNLRIKYVTTKSGLRLPRNPAIFAAVIVWLSKNITDYENHATCRDAIKQAGITSNTPVPLLLGLYKVFDEDQQFEVASKHISASTPLQLCKDFCEFYSKNKISGMDPAPELSEIKEGLIEYMNAAITHLSPQKKSLED